MDKVRENRVRRSVARQGFRLVASGRRDPRAADYGRYSITDPATGLTVDGCDLLTLDEAEGRAFAGLGPPTDMPGKSGDRILRADKVASGDRLLLSGRLHGVTGVSLGRHPETGAPYAAIGIQGWKYTANYPAAELVAVRRPEREKEA